MAYIYKITNLVNNKIYIGETIRNIKDRFKEHIRESLQNTGHGFFYYLHCAIRKYGENQFVIHILEECDDDIRFERETYYINKYNSTDPNIGYNQVVEGSGRTLYPTDKILELWKQGLTCREIAQQLQCHRATIENRIRGLNLDTKRNFKKYIQQRDGYEVERYDLNGNFIKKYITASEAAKELNGNAGCIKAVCRQQQLQTLNSLWKYAHDSKDIQEWVYKNEQRGRGGGQAKKVLQYDANMNLINEFTSTGEATKFMGKKDRSNICRGIREKVKVYGYYWKYIKRKNNE